MKFSKLALIFLLGFMTSLALTVLVLSQWIEVKDHAVTVKKLPEYCSTLAIKKPAGLLIVGGLAVNNESMDIALVTDSGSWSFLVDPINSSFSYSPQDTKKYASFYGGDNNHVPKFMITDSGQIYEIDYPSMSLSKSDPMKQTKDKK